MKPVGILGATSLVGYHLLPLLVQSGARVTAFSRNVQANQEDGIEWVSVGQAVSPLELSSSSAGEIPSWICLAPIWVLPSYFDFLVAMGARRVVALSSSSRFSKQDSSDIEEQAVARRLMDNEARLQSWAKEKGVEYVILRPTLIYDLGRDRNISEIARFIRWFWFFPVLGQASGLRQPVHAEDVARACVRALDSDSAPNHAYNLSGGEILTYRDMVGRVFAVLNRSPRILHVPLVLFRFAIACLRCLPRYRRWSVAMAERMNRDLVFDHSEAVRDLDFEPRAFLGQNVDGFRPFASQEKPVANDPVGTIRDREAV